MKRAPVRTKQDFYRRWVDGEFGNRIRGWSSFSSLMDDDYSGLVNVRNVTPSSNVVKFGVLKSQVPAVIRELGGSASDYRFNEPAPDENLLIQGEVCEDHRGWWLMYNCAKIKMREAMQDATHASGLVAKSILREFCCPSSYDDLKMLLDIYPEHSIEFGVYSLPLGDVKNRNTIIWEVRRY